MGNNVKLILWELNVKLILVTCEQRSTMRIKATNAAKKHTLQRHCWGRRGLVLDRQTCIPDLFPEEKVWSVLNQKMRQPRTFYCFGTEDLFAGRMGQNNISNDSSLGNLNARMSSRRCKKEQQQPFWNVLRVLNVKMDIYELNQVDKTTYEFN